MTQRNFKSRVIKYFTFISIIYFLGISLYSYNIFGLESVYTDSFPLQTYDSRFYVVYLEVGTQIEINVTNTYMGDFDIFIHNARPRSSHVDHHGYDPAIYINATVWDTGSGPEASVLYTAEDSILYYIQVTLISGETDTYHLSSNQVLELYFIPFLIPGYSIPLLLTITLISLIIIWKWKIQNRIQFRFFKNLK